MRRMIAVGILDSIVIKKVMNFLGTGKGFPSPPVAKKENGLRYNLLTFMPLAGFRLRQQRAGSASNRQV